jgi:hypothetical protein
MLNSNKQACIDNLCGSLTRSANWRRGLHAKFNDPRNGRAAERLDQLASETNDLSDESWEQLQKYFNWASEKWSTAVSEACRLVEFRGVRTLPAFTKSLVGILSQSSVAA